MDGKFKVLIVDDSTVFRSQIRAALDGVEAVEVVGFASNGRLAIEILKTKQIDLVTLDLEMPEMNGIETLGEMKRLGIRAKTIVFSAHTKSGAESTLKALNAGASDFLMKPTLAVGTKETPADVIRSVLLPKIAQFHSPLKNTIALTTPGPSNAPANSVYNKVNWDLLFPKVVVIASSTGGPNALEKFFSRLRLPLQCPILIAQHMPALFTASLAERLARVSGIPVREAINGETLTAGTVYIAPGDYHMKLAQEGLKTIIRLDQEAQRNSVRPAADFLFETAAAIFKEKCLGIVLTGMGADGCNGAIAIKKNSGAVMIQNKESCIVFGMPGAVFEAKAYDKIGTLDQLAEQLAQLRVCGELAKIA